MKIIILWSQRHPLYKCVQFKEIAQPLVLFRKQMQLIGVQKFQLLPWLYLLLASAQLSPRELETFFMTLDVCLRL